MSLSPERWQQVKEIFGASLDVTSGERPRYVAERAQGDRELEREVTSLLRALEKEADLFERSALHSLGGESVGDLSAEASLVGRRLGHYQVTREIGHGGMGVVYEAVREDGEFQQRVALKTIGRGRNSDLIIRRFRQERQILAALSHRNIAALLDGGVTEDAQPYFIMEYVDGAPIDTWCAAHRLGVRERLVLFRQVCSAVQYAHSNLVVHRDLKPANILVTSDGSVKLLDFGIAKLLGDEADGGSSLTRAGVHPLTTAYASPEQVLGEPITTGSDVYSLGVVLYELLAGQPPFPVSGLSALELQRRISEEEPRRPSRVVTADTAATTTEGSMSRLARALSGELDHIVMMALRKEARRRYASVEQLSEDVRRFLEHLPILARPDEWQYRTGKFIRRNRGAVLGAGVAVLALIAGALSTAVQGRAALRQAALAKQERDRAEQVSLFLQGVVGAADPSWYAPAERLGGDSLGNVMLDAVARRVEAELSASPEVRGTVLRTLGKANMVRARFDLSEQQVKTALALHRRDRTGSASLDVAIDLTLLGRVFDLTGRSVAGDSVNREARDLFAQLGDSTSFAFAEVSNQQGLNALARGLVREAGVAFRRTAHVIEGLGRDSTGEYAIILGNIALVADNLGQVAEAEKEYLRSLAAFAHVKTRDYFERGFSLHNLALIRSLNGDAVSAESLMTEADMVWTRFLGPSHPSVAVSQLGLARVLHGANKNTKAMPHVLRAERIIRPRLPPDHPDVARLDGVYGQVLVGLGRLAEGERRLRNAIVIREKSFAAGDWRIGELQKALGVARTKGRRFVEAESLLTTGYDKLRAQLGEAHPRTVEGARFLAELYDAWSKPDDARRWRARSLAGER